MTKKHIGIVSIALISSLVFTGCSSLSKEIQSAAANQQMIHLSVEGNSYDVERLPMNWVELDQLETYETVRKTWDDKLNIIRFDTNSKNGSLFVEKTGDWSGNNTLYNVFQNKVFVKDYWSDSKLRSELAKSAIEQFSDISNENTGIIASVNAYFNILPGNVDETSGMFNYLTRGEVMAAIYRGDTPVVLLDENEEFKNAVGESEFNIYAQEVTSDSYLDYNNGSLNVVTYNETMTRAEAVYMIIHRYYADELANMTGKESGLADCKNAGNVAEKQGIAGSYGSQAFELEYCLQYKDKGVTDELYKALVLAERHGIITLDTRWYDGITAGELIQMLIKTYDGLYDDNNFIVNAKVGANAGSVPVIEDEEEKPEIIIENIVSEVAVQKIKDISDIEDLIRVYGDELDMTPEEIEEAKRNAEGYTIEACDKYMLVDFCSWLNVRKGPSTDFDIKKSVKKDTKVHIVGRCAENGWYRVIADGKIAYQCGVYFSDLPGEDTSNLVQEYE